MLIFFFSFPTSLFTRGNVSTLEVVDEETHRVFMDLVNLGTENTTVSNISISFYLPIAQLNDCILLVYMSLASIYFQLIFI